MEIFFTKQITDAIGVTTNYNQLISTSFLHAAGKIKVAFAAFISQEHKEEGRPAYKVYEVEVSIADVSENVITAVQALNLDYVSPEA